MMPEHSKYPAERLFIARLLDSFQKRPIKRQIRTEELACLAIDVLKEFTTNADSNWEDQQNRYNELMGRLGSFSFFPTFTLAIFKNAIEFIKSITPDHEKIKPDSPPDLMTEISAAIREQICQANNYFLTGKYLLFCRVAEPIRKISEDYLNLKFYNKLSGKEKLNDVFKDLNDKKEHLEHEQKNDPNWTETKRWELLAGSERRKKRIWSGATIKFSDEHLFKIVHYSKNSLMGFSNLILQKNQTLNFYTHFNSIDLEFDVKAEINEEATDYLKNSLMKDLKAEKKGSAKAYRINLQIELQKFIQKFNHFPHTYVLRFKDNTPNPQYYFLSMCRDLTEQRYELQHEFFSELFCWDINVPAVLD
ncbi:MAG TPA: hypothetical protein VM123_17370 [archaeon]|nr:hypothetical protein [archaeon]